MRKIIELLIDKLKNLNFNINWEEFLGKNIDLIKNKDLENIVKKIIPSLWYDKSIDVFESENVKYFLYYTYLLQKHNTTHAIQILDYQPFNYPTNLIRLLDVKKHVLITLLSAMSVEYEIVNKISNDYKYLVPIGSMTHENINEQIKNYTGVIVEDDDLFNFKLHDTFINDILLRCILLMGRNIEYEDIKDCKFYYIEPF